MAIVNQGTSQSYEFCDDGKGEMAKGSFSTFETNNEDGISVFLFISISEVKDRICFRLEIFF